MPSRFRPKYRPFLGASGATVLTTEVRKMRSPQTPGDDQPLPGISVFQTTLRVALQVSGSAGSSATPVDCGPRNCGQESAAPSGSASRKTVKASAGVRITSTLLPRGTLERPRSRDSHETFLAAHRI